MTNVIDKSVVEGLMRDIGETMIPIIAQSVATDLSARFLTLKAACKAEDAVGVREQSHALKSAVRTIGLMRLGEKLAELEISVGENQWSEIHACVEILDPMVDESQVALKGLVDHGLGDLP